MSIEPVMAASMPVAMALMVVRNSSPIANPSRPNIIPPMISPMHPSPSCASSCDASLVIVWSLLH